MVLIVVFAPAHLTTDSLFAAIPDLRANMQRKDIMRSGLWPPVGFASDRQSQSHTNVPHAWRQVQVH